ncbi:MAG: hypothetical protein J6A75_03365 [Lachnospiraceae bacterium]|nr:hypothetical protein [Lachnospiraceae bacterium]
MSNGNSANKTNNESPDMLIDVFGAKTFFKVYQCLGIGKMKFSFVDKENPKDKAIDIYLDADIFSCDLIEQIKNGELRQKGNIERQRAKNANEKYCKAIWNSPAGISAEQKVRQFEIQPGNATEFVFRATEEKKQITVGCDYRSLRLMAERWSYLKADYDDLMRRKYSLANMQNEYRKNGNGSQQAPAQQEQPKATQTVANAVTSTPPASAVAPTTPQAKPIGFGMGSTQTQQAPVQKQEEQPKAQQTPAPQGNKQEFKMKITTPIADMANGKKALKAITADNVEYPCIFPAELCKHNAFSEFEKRCSRAGNVIKVRGVIGKNGDTDVIFVSEAM